MADLGGKGEKTAKEIWPYDFLMADESWEKLRNDSGVVSSFFDCLQSLQKQEQAAQEKDKKNRPEYGFIDWHMACSHMGVPGAVGLARYRGWQPYGDATQGARKLYTLRLAAAEAVYGRKLTR